MRKRTKAAIDAKALPAVCATVTVQGNRGLITRTVQLWDGLPGWWNRASIEQRRAWLASYFSRGARLSPGELVVSAEVRIP